MQQLGRVALFGTGFHFLDSFSDLLPACVQPAFYGARRDVQRLGDLLDRLPAHIKAHHDLPMRFGQIPKRAADVGERFLAVVVERFLGNVKRHVVEGNLGLVVFVAQPVAMDIGHNAVQPSPDVLRLFSLRQRRQRREEGFLRKLLGGIGVSGFAQGGAIQAVDIGG